VHSILLWETETSATTPCGECQFRDESETGLAVNRCKNDAVYAHGERLDNSWCGSLCFCAVHAKLLSTTEGHILHEKCWNCQEHMTDANLNRIFHYNEPSAEPSAEKENVQADSDFNTAETYKDEYKITAHYKYDKPVLDNIGVGDFVQSAADALVSAIENQNTRYAIRIIESNQGVSLQSDRDGFFPLHKAIMSGNLSVFKRLLLDGADVNCSQHFETPLILAAKKNDLNIVKELVKFGADVNIAPYFMSPLAMATYMNNPDIVRELLRASAQVNYYDDDGLTALHDAARYGYIQIVQMLLQAGANQNLQNVEGNTALHLAMEERSGHPCAKYLLENADLSLLNAEGKTAYDIAIRFSSVDLLTLFQAKGVDLLMVKRKNLNALDWAVVCKNPTAVNYILSFITAKTNKATISTNICHAIENADYDIFLLFADQPFITLVTYNTLSSNGYNAMHMAISLKNYRMAKFLYKIGVDLNAKGKYNFTPLLLAVYECDYILCLLLLQHKADPHCVDEDLKSALHYAAKKKKNDAVDVRDDEDSTEEDYLSDEDYVSDEDTEDIKKDDSCLIVSALLLYGCNINAIDVFGVTPFFYACLYSRYAMIILLHSNKADINMKTRSGDTALINAIKKRKHKVASLLLKLGADIMLLNREKCSAFDYACRNNMQTIAMKISEHVSFKVDHGDMKATFKSVLEKKYYTILSFLATLPNFFNGNGTYLICAVAALDYQAVCILIPACIDINEKDKKGNTALHIAIKNCSIKIIVVLLKAKIDINIKNHGGKPALHYAKKCTIQIKALYKKYAR
jgi:ankyrin repeat protein